MLNTIYALKNTMNDKVYIGQTWSTLSKRWRNSNGYKECPLVWNAINKYGKDNFYYEELMTCVTQVGADFWETYYIEKFNSCDRKLGYNLKVGGQFHYGCNEETKKKISNSRKGKCVGTANPMYQNPQYGFQGKQHSEETKRKISEAQKIRLLNKKETV